MISIVHDYACIHSHLSSHRRRAVAVETTCTASDACTEAGKSRRATVVGVDDDERLLGDGDNVGGATAGERSLANRPADVEPKALLAVGCWCSGVVGSDDTPGLLDGLRRLLSGVSSFGETPFRTASFLSNELPTIYDCFELSQSKKLVKNPGSSPSVTAYTVVSIDLPP